MCRGYVVQYWTGTEFLLLCFFVPRSLVMCVSLELGNNTTKKFRYLNAFKYIRLVMTLCLEFGQGVESYGSLTVGLSG